LRKEDKSPNEATDALSASVQNEPTAAESTAAECTAVEPFIVQNEATGEVADVQNEPTDSSKCEIDQELEESEGAPTWKERMELIARAERLLADRVATRERSRAIEMTIVDRQS
jgi:hypothetical protein